MLIRVVGTSVNPALALEAMAALVDSGKLRPVVGAEFAFEDIKRAHALSESGHATGGSLLTSAGRRDCGR